jgi:subtilisin family serine protease
LSRRRKVSGSLLAVALIASLLSVPAASASAYTAAAAQAPGSTQAGAPGTQASGRITLVTGDQLYVSGSKYSLESQPRPGVSFVAYTNQDGHLNVIPSDAFNLLGSGEVDSRLFDVTALLESGLGDRPDVPLIIAHDKGAKATARSSVANGGGHVVRELPSINSLAVRADNAKANGVWKQLTTGDGRGRKLRSGVAKIWLDGVRRPTLDQSVPQVGAPTAWAAGYDGTGVKIGIVDSGIDSTHPDLAGKVVAASDFTGEGLQDLLGHGTHVASIAAGTGAGSGGQYRGVAPGASLISAKACVVTNICFDSAIIAGLQFAAEQGADVINLSLGGADTPGVDPLEQQVNAVSATFGTLVVAAAGNTPFPAPSYSVSSPSTADAALSVGAVDGADNLAYFSNRGPRVSDTAIKPEITAPGVGITAARSSTSSLPGDLYTELSGTSMASPHVAGAAAIVAQRHPAWTPAQLKAALMNNALQTPGARVFDTGAGRLNVARAYNAFVLSSPSSISLGRQVAPHADDPVITRTITYTNTDPNNGANLSLLLTARDPSGAAAPAGMFTLSTNSISLQPGGTATVTFTAKTSLSVADGFYDGYVTAFGQAGGINVTTPFAVHSAPAGREYTFNHIDRSGNYAAGYSTLLLPLTSGKPVYQLFSTSIGPAGPRTDYIESGDYLLYSAIPDASSGGMSVLVQPKFTVTAGAPATIDIDSSTAQPLNVTVPNSAAVTWLQQVGAGYMGTNVAVSSMVWSPTAAIPPMWTKQLGPANVFTPNFMGKVRLGLAVPPGGGANLSNSTQVYNTAWFVDQQFPTGITKNVTAGQLAAVTASHGKHVDGSVGFKDSEANPNGALFPLQSLGFIRFVLPHTRTEYYNTDGNIRWYSRFLDLVNTSPEQHSVNLESRITTLTAGTTTTDAWNKPVYGPALGNVLLPLDWVVRRGDTIYFNPPMVGDSAGHTGFPESGYAVSDLTGTATLKRNGVVVATAAYPGTRTIPPSATVPPDWSPYTLETTMSRGAPTVLGTQISAIWSFNSSTVDANSVLRLPLWAVTFKPALNADNVAPAGSFQIPLTAVAQPDSPVAGINTITVQYSTNDGATWQNATVTGSGANRTATVTNPNTTGFVSLRATATDFAGNSVTQTTIRAYKIGS